MTAQPTPRIGRYVLAIAVTGGHVFVLWLLVLAATTRERIASDEVLSVWLGLEALQVDSPQIDAPQIDARVYAHRGLPRGPLQAPRAAPAQPVTATAMPMPGNEQDGTGAVDWHAAAASVARARIEAGRAAKPRAFGEQPRSPYRPCKRRRSSFEWSEEPKQAGFAGPIPYVRLGQNCIVVLTFFGCALGDPPPANGRLFDDLERADPPRSSVPGPEDCEPDSLQTETSRDRPPG